MRRFALIIALTLPLFAPLGAAAEGIWTTMTGEDITAALSDKKLRYKAATQVFKASGKTLYNQGGRESWGEWRVEDNKYCSLWPSQGLWTCYHMDRSGDKVRFIGQGDDITVGSYTE